MRNCASEKSLVEICFLQWHRLKILFHPLMVGQSKIRYLIIAEIQIQIQRSSSGRLTTKLYASKFQSACYSLEARFSKHLDREFTLHIDLFIYVFTFLVVAGEDFARKRLL